jgi:hypothetical protein
MAQAREEYLYVYSVYVLEASTSSRLTHFYPPLNLVALFFFRPWRIIFPKDDRFRHSRVIALKVTHFPIVLVIQGYEWLCRKISEHQEKDPWAGFSGGRTRSNSEAPNPSRGNRPAIGSPRHSGGSKNQMARSYGHHWRLMNGSDTHLMVDNRPPSSAAWSATDDEDAAAPTNAELMKSINKLTEIVIALEQRIAEKKTAT